MESSPLNSIEVLSEFIKKAKSAYQINYGTHMGRQPQYTDDEIAEAQIAFEKIKSDIDKYERIKETVR